MVAEASVRSSSAGTGVLPRRAVRGSSCAHIPSVLLDPSRGRSPRAPGNTLITFGTLIPPVGGFVTDVVIASACRTPIGKYGRALRNLEAGKVGSIGIEEAVSRAGLAGGARAEGRLGM